MDLTTDPPHTPPPVPVCDPEPDFEVDVDLADEDELHGQGDDETAVLARATLPESVEYLGEYEDLPAFFRSQLEDLIDSSVHWALDCLNYEAIQERFESDGCRYFVECGQVFRIGGAS